MSLPDPADEYLQRLRRWRGGKADDWSMHFVDRWFKQHVARPHKQLGQLVQLWEKHIPADLAGKTALHSFQRGVLKVEVADSATLYHLDRMLRSGLEQTIRSQWRGSLRSIRLQLGDPRRFTDTAQGEP